MYGYDSFINDHEEVIAKGDPNEEGYQGPPYSPEIDEMMDNSYEERSVNSSGLYIGSEVVLPGNKGETLTRKINKLVRYYDTSTGKASYNAIHDNSIYEIEYPDGTMEQVAANIIAKNMMSQFDSKGFHYQVLTEVNDQNKDDSAIAKAGGFINSSSGNLHRKRKTCGWKLLVE